MPQNADLGHATNVANFKTLITYVTAYGNNYAPSNNKIKLAQLQTALTNAENAMAACTTTLNKYNADVDARKETFQQLRPLATRIVQALRASDMSKEVIANAITINRKLQPPRSKKKEADPAPDEKKHSSSQQSMTLLIANFKALVDLAEQQTAYDPSESDLKIAALKTYLTDLETVNNKIAGVYNDWLQARNNRDSSLYDPAIGLVELSRLVKVYVKSVFKTGSVEAKQCAQLKFVTR